MEFRYGTAFMSESPEAYERLILDAMRGDATLFTRNDEIEALWGIIDPILTAWHEDTDSEIPQYPAGTAGPRRLTLCSRPGRAGSGCERRVGHRGARRRPGRGPVVRAGHDRRTGSTARCGGCCTSATPRTRRSSPPGCSTWWCSSIATGRARSPTASGGSAATTPRAPSCARSSRAARTLDAWAAMSYDESGSGGGVMHEQVEIDLGEEHLSRLDTILDPVIVSELPTMVWSPHGHRDAVESMRRMIDVMLLDSDDGDGGDDGFSYAAEMLETGYVVDLAWLRTTPWRERLASSFDPPWRREMLATIERIEIRHRESTHTSALLLAGWLASRLGWKPEPLRETGRSRLEGRRPSAQAGGRAGARAQRAGRARPARGHRRLRRRLLPVARPRSRRTGARVSAGTAMSASWQVLGASRGEGGILGEGVRQAHLRDPTYGPALERRPEASAAVSVELEIVEDPARACAAMMVGAAAGGGHVVLTGGSTPRVAYEEFVRAVRAVDADVVGHPLLVRRRALCRARGRAVELPDGPGGAVRAARRRPGHPPDRRRGRPGGWRRGLRGRTSGGGRAGVRPAAARDGSRRTRRLAVSRPGHARGPRPARRRRAARRTRAVRAAGLVHAHHDRPGGRGWRSSSRARARRRRSSGRSERRREPTREVPASLVPTVAEHVTVLLDPAAAARL